MAKNFTLVLIEDDEVESRELKALFSRDVFDIFDISPSSKQSIRLDMLVSCDLAIIDIDHFYSDTVTDPNGINLAIYHDLLKQLKHRFHDCVIIGLTSISQRESLKQILDNRLEHIFLKPYQKNQLIGKIFELFAHFIQNVTEQLNEQHKGIALEARRLMALLEQPNVTDQALYHRVGTLVATVQDHFSYEESFMKSHNYPQRAEHEQLHFEMLNTIKGLLYQSQVGQEQEILKQIVTKLKHDMTHDAHLLEFIDRQYQLLQK